MTEAQIRKQVVDTAVKYLGCKESDGSHKKIIDIYNNHKPLARGYAVKYTDAWCATFVSVISILCGYTDIMPTECGCPKMIELYKNLGRWQESDSYVPKKGDVIMYDWQDSGSGDNTGNPDHVGIVVSVSGTTIKVIEGNIDNAVGYRTIQVNGKNIRGYCIPDFASKVTKQSSKPAVTITLDPAKVYDRTVAGSYTVTASSLNMRRGAGTTKGIIKELPKGEKFRCYGYYTKVGTTVWLLGVDSTGTAGYCSKRYLM